MQINVNIHAHKAALFLEILKSLDFVVSVETPDGESVTDWWDELPDSVKQDYDEGLKEMEQGNEVDVEDFLKKYISK